MSRIGKKVINVPAGTKVEVKEQVITATGKLGALSYTVPAEIAIKLDNGALTLSIDEKRAKELNAIHGTTRANVFNIIEGVTNGFSKKLEVNGVGYRVAKQGKTLNLTLGFSHPVTFDETDDIKIDVPDANTIIISGADKQKVGQFAAEVREKRPPEPYKGKGIKYADEVIRRKEGKAAKGAKK